MVVLNKLHNLMLNCSNINEFKDHVVCLICDNVYNECYDSVLDNALSNPVLAAECTIIPMYYFKASTKSGMKQDRFGQFYKV